MLVALIWTFAFDMEFEGFDMEFEGNIIFDSFSFLFFLTKK